MNILIIKLNATGDVVRTTTLLHRLQGEITWVTAPNNVVLLDGLRPNVRCISWENRAQALDRTYDLVISLEDEAETAAKYYTGIFPGSRMGRIAYFGHAGFEHHGRPAGSVMTVEFFLEGQCFTALNGGPLFKFNEAISLMVACKDQAVVDYYWDALS